MSVEDYMLSLFEVSVVKGRRERDEKLFVLLPGCHNVALPADITAL